MRRLLLGLLLAGLFVPAVGGCASGCELSPPPGDEVKLRAQLVGFAGQTLRVVRLPDEILGADQDLVNQDPSATTTLDTAPVDTSTSDTDPGETVPGDTVPGGAEDAGPDGSDEFDPAAVDPADIIEIDLIGSADQLEIGGEYEITAYSDASRVVAVLDRDCRGADTIKNLDGSNIGGWGIGFGTAVTVGLLILLPMLAVIGAVYVARFAFGRRQGPTIRPGRL